MPFSPSFHPHILVIDVWWGWSREFAVSPLPYLLPYWEGLVEGWAQLSPSPTLCILSSWASYSLTADETFQSQCSKDGRWELPALRAWAQK